MAGVRGTARITASAEAQLRDGLLQHLLIELDADLADMAGLFLAQQIAGAADVHVVAGDGEARAELIQRLEHLQPSLRRLGDLVRRGRREVGVAKAAVLREMHRMGGAAVALEIFRRRHRVARHRAQPPRDQG